jgi:hypothetical protein
VCIEESGERGRERKKKKKKKKKKKGFFGKKKKSAACALCCSNLPFPPSYKVQVMRGYLTYLKIKKSNGKTTLERKLNLGRKPEDVFFFFFFLYIFLDINMGLNEGDEDLRFKTSSGVAVTGTFEEMPLPDTLLRGIYAHGFRRPSAIQSRAIVPIAKGRDVVCQAQSGTGKTATFSIGALARIAHRAA